MWTTLRKILMPKVFFVGIFAGLVACSAAGRYCAARNPFENFRRFHRALSAETYFYATVSQMVAMIKEELAEGKTVIVVGGNSIAEGRGQGKDLWTVDLQGRLGPTYKVLNLAQPGMPALTGPYVAFLSLAPKHRNLYYVAVTQPLYTNGPETPWAGYSYWWDAYYKELLPYFPHLSEAIDERIKIETSSQRAEREECQLEEFLDSIFYFQDLWSTIAYKSFFTVWTEFTAPTFLAPRKEYPDEDPPPIPIETRFNAFNRDEELHEITRNFKFIFEFNQTTNNWQFSKRTLDWFKQSIANSVPDQLRSQVLMIDVRRNPLIMSRTVTEDELSRSDKVSEKSKIIWEAAGVSAIYAGKDFQVNDYLDGCHLSPSGGAKLSAAVASKLADMQRSNSLRRF